MFADRAYQVSYADAQGVKHKATKPFKVARHDALGNLLDAELFTAARLAALTKARAFWNEHDKSSMGRYLEANDT